MWTARRIIVVVTGALGVALIVRGVWGGVWPLSLQAIAGVLLVIMAALRWRTLG